MKQFKTIQLTIILGLLIMLQACQPKSDAWNFIGNTTYSGKVFLYQIDPNLNKSLADSTEINSGKFTFKSTNENERLTAFQIVFDKVNDNNFEFLIRNGEKLKANINDEFNIVFSGTPMAEIYTKFISFRKKEMNNLMELKQILNDESLDEDETNSKMLVYKEKMQELENEKIDFLRTIQDPELNAYLVLREAISSATIEKEVFGKYVNALTPEGSMTRNGHKMHQIYEVFGAYALSRELDLLDTATIRERYNKLEDDSKNSEYAQAIRERLNSN